MNTNLKITVMMDQGAIPDDDPDFLKGSVVTSTEAHVVMALRELGHKPGILGVGHEVEPIIHYLKESPADLVFNLTEQFRDDRRLDASVAGLLELMGARYTGTGPAGLMICRDKGLCKQILSRHRIRVPNFAVLHPGRSLRITKAMQYPVIVKPIFEDASEGISKASLVKNADEFRERAEFVHQKFKQIAIGEEYIEGRELYVTIIGNKRLTVLPPREIVFGDDTGVGPIIATSKVKFDNDYRDKWNIQYKLAKLPDQVFKNVARAGKRAYRHLQIRDYGRVDMRLTEDNRIIILEVNPNPDIAYGEDVAESAAAAGIGYNDLIAKIVRYALRRYE